MSQANLNPPEMQRYVVEHIVKNDDSTMHSTQRLRSFSGRLPRPQNESDYDIWRSGVELLLQDPGVSDLQRSRKIFDSLLPPAADVVKHLRSDTPPTVYLQTLDSAYGTVQDGDELYAKFMDTFQDAGEKPSHYLQRLQVALNQAVKRGGVLNRDFGRHLLTQFCRGCWDNSLITELQLKQRKHNPPSFAEFLLLLRTEEDREAAKTIRMKQHLGSSRPRAAAHAQYAYTDSTEKGEIAALTNITQQLAQQLADVQKQLAILTASQSSSSQSALKSTPGCKLGEGQRAGKPSKNPSSVPKPGYCYRCGEDGHIKPQCDNPPNSALVATKRKQFTEKQKRWQQSDSPSRHHLN
ncbi:paraneoplastic antigen Ma3 homolog [Cololabis saira]|uniref:paraneoplastic antigen Ma3 homolog n=1 Tax=Cololabis saira TaxID=129043 RepID=UPI002AD49E09|nr:paraneoplastic antigen Ma3 homolog [Cololabis saira]